ncbi:tetratricopeptide repeat protein [Candidatus Gracilibacteria bacterium]|jgi:tetratricopeptide (TPR) repeat protein|nr:tetratricopeptide repeat protein [Candidatus Gracilibacteria bacterium]NJM87898.1 tetratricopeptide repeat protein [Hydrococcus sp. RU_2_2]NJP18551.1 tetratricopeptide repeat protein [Hydrococcus sp. CRU_1_1]
MKTALKLGLLAISIAAWFLLIQPAQALSPKNCHLSNNHPTTVMPNFQPTVELPSERVNHHHFWLANCLMLSGQAGVDACHCAIATNPTNPLTWNNLGQKLFGLGRYSEALISYNHALLIIPNYSLALANRCGVLDKLKRYSEALTSCELALGGDKQWGSGGEALAWNNQGDILFNLGLYEEALASFERALAINPNHEGANWNRMVMLHKLGRPIQ